MPDDDPKAANRRLQKMFGVPEHLDLDSDYIRQVASVGLNTGKLTSEQIVELCGSVMAHIASRDRPR